MPVKAVLLIQSNWIIIEFIPNDAIGIVMRGGMAWVALVSLLVSGWAQAALAESADDINRLIDAAKHGSNPALYRLGTIICMALV